MPIIGIIDSQKSGHLFTPIVGAYDALATVTLSGGQTTVNFVGIPNTYSHLQIRGIARWNSSTADFRSSFMTLNGDGGANYATHLFSADGATAGFAASAARTNMNYIGGNLYGGANAFTGFVIDILDYASTTKNKTVRSLAGYDVNGAGRIDYASGLWTPTTPVAVTVITFGIQTDSFAANSTFSLYGVR